VFSHNFKNFLNIYFVYRKSSIGKKSLFDFLNKKWFDLSVAFMSMHLGFSCMQKAFKTRLGADQKLLRIFWLFMEFILTFPELFLFIGMV
jgi:hypothetical protein